MPLAHERLPKGKTAAHPELQLCIVACREADVSVAAPRAVWEPMILLENGGDADSTATLLSFACLLGCCCLEGAELVPSARLFSKFSPDALALFSFSKYGQ